MGIRECKISNKKATSKRIYTFSYKKWREKDCSNSPKSTKKKGCINSTKRDNKDTSN